MFSDCKAATIAFKATGSFGKDAASVDIQIHTTNHNKTPLKVSNYRQINHPTRAGGAPQSGLRQSMPSHNIAICAEVKRKLPEDADGQGKRPRSRTL
jgi:hypothetical protein